MWCIWCRIKIWALYPNVPMKRASHISNKIFEKFNLTSPIITNELINVKKKQWLTLMSLPTKKRLEMLR